MPLALLPEARVVLRAGRHGVRDARVGCLWLLDWLRSSVGATGAWTRSGFHEGHKERPRPGTERPAGRADSESEGVLDAGGHLAPGAPGLAGLAGQAVASHWVYRQPVSVRYRAMCGRRRCQRRARVSEVIDGRDNRPAVQWFVLRRQEEKCR